MVETARCGKCGPKPLTAFNRRRSGKPSSYCKACQNAYSKQHYARTKPKTNARRYEHHKDHRKKLKQLIDQLKAVPCTDCVEPHPSWAMDFDHRDPSTKLFNIGSAVRLGVTIEKLMEEIAKCDVVCALCHRYRTYGIRRGPATTWSRATVARGRSSTGE